MFNLFRNNGKKNLRKITYESSSANILHDESEFVVNEAYKAMRTNIMFSFHDDKGCKTIICTSAMPGEGKTTTCINMAISFAQTGNKVLLIDGDLRKPKVGRYLDIEDTNGISDYLGGFLKDYNSIIKHVEDKSLDCITAGSVPPNPAELLGSDMMGDLLSELSEKYDYIFVDAPPVNVVTDAIVVAKFCTGVVVVVKENNTTHDMLSNALGVIKFANIRILGLVVNGSEVRRNGKYRYNKKSYGYGYGGYGYGYGYGYGGYGYGYGYGDENSKKRRKKADEIAEKKKVDEEKIQKQEQQNPNLEDVLENVPDEEILNAQKQNETVQNESQDKENEKNE